MFGGKFIMSETHICSFRIDFKRQKSCSANPFASFAQIIQCRYFAIFKGYVYVRRKNMNWKKNSLGGGTKKLSENNSESRFFFLKYSEWFCPCHLLASYIRILAAAARLAASLFFAFSRYKIWKIRSMLLCFVCSNIYYTTQPHTTSWLT